MERIRFGGKNKLWIQRTIKFDNCLVCVYILWSTKFHRIKLQLGITRWCIQITKRSNLLTRVIPRKKQVLFIVLLDETIIGDNIAFSNYFFFF